MTKSNNPKSAEDYVRFGLDWLVTQRERKDAQVVALCDIVRRARECVGDGTDAAAILDEALDVV